MHAGAPPQAQFGVALLLDLGAQRRQHVDRRRRDQQGAVAEVVYAERWGRCARRVQSAHEGVVDV